MPDLTDDTKLWIVAQLAAFASPSVVQKELEENGLKVSLQQLSVYDPNTFAGRKLRKAFRDVFDAVRKKTIEDESDIAIAHRSYRLRKLQEIFDESGRNKVLKTKVLEQAAKETGGIYVRHIDEAQDEITDDLPADLEAALAKVYGEKPKAEPVNADTVSGQ